MDRVLIQSYGAVLCCAVLCYAVLCCAVLCTTLDHSTGWGFMSYQPGSYYSTTPDEVEYMASRAVAWGAAPGIESDALSLSQNNRTTEGLAVMKPWFALAKRLPPQIKLQLRGLGPDREKEHRLVRSDGSAAASASETGGSDENSEVFIEIGQMHPSMVLDPKVPSSCAIALQPFFAEVTSWGVRIRALSAVQGWSGSVRYGGDAAGSQSGSSSSSSLVDLLQLHGNVSAITRVNKCTGARAPSELGGSMTATISSSPPAGSGSSTALKLDYQASRIPAKSGVADIGCVDSSFATPMNLSTHRVMELQLWSDCDGSCGCEWGYLGVQLQAGGGFRDFIVGLNFSGWRTVRLDVPASRDMYTTDFPKPGNENMASRGFGWSGVAMASYYVSNFSRPNVTLFLARLDALQETAASAGENAALRIGDQSIRLPASLQGKPCVVGHVSHTPAQPGFPSGKPTVLGCADYVECRDVRNASSCRAFDANNNVLLSAAGHSYHDDTDTDDYKQLLLDGQAPRRRHEQQQQPPAPVVYTAAQTAARVSVTVFEWSQGRLGPY
jgi:hypothetical protein